LEGPLLLQIGESSVIVKTQDPELVPFIKNAIEFDSSAWIDASKEVGPRHYSSPKYWITFAVNTMPRQVAGTEYLKQFMKELVEIRLSRRILWCRV
jgi:hypothetical protein